MSSNGHTRASRTATTPTREQLKEQLGYSSIMRVPRVSKITLNMGVGEAKTETKLLDSTRSRS